jgi:hypothetical protein
MNSILLAQRAAKARHFRTGIFYELKPSLTINNEDLFENGAEFKYAKITDEYKLAYLGSHISLQQNDVVIETYAPFNWKAIKSKIKLDTGRELRIKTATPFEEVISPVSIIKKWTITLG